MVSPVVSPKPLFQHFTPNEGRTSLHVLVWIGHLPVQGFRLPDFSWDVVPRFVHCGPDYKPNVPGHPPRLPLAEIYRRMSRFPMATLEKFTLQTSPPVNIDEEAKLVQAARAIKSYNTSTRVIFYHMAWQVPLVARATNALPALFSQQSRSHLVMCSRSNYPVTVEYLFTFALLELSSIQSLQRDTASCAGTLDDNLGQWDHPGV